VTVEVRRQRAEIRVPQAPFRRWRPYWWVYPSWVVFALSLFGLYALFAILQGWDQPVSKEGLSYPYLSPFYSPSVFIKGLPISPAFYVAWVPLGFRLTCYYYRKAYFRSFFRQPPACAIPDRPGKYNGETRLPFVLNNAHRFFLYVTLFVLGFLWWDAIQAFDLHGQFFIGLGSVIMLVNVILLSGYTLGCHALRNLVGGGINCFSCSRNTKARHGVWRFVSVLNGNHALWAWCSMISVGGADIYIRLLIHHVIHDPRWIPS
jgi:hypothetical protein